MPMISVASSPRLEWNGRGYECSVSYGRQQVVSSLQLLMGAMSELVKVSGKRYEKYRLQSFIEYLDGYSMAFDMFPDCSRQPTHSQDAYRVLQDYWDISEDLTRSVRARIEATNEDADEAAVNGKQARPVQS